MTSRRERTPYRPTVSLLLAAGACSAIAYGCGPSSPVAKRTETPVTASAEKQPEALPMLPEKKGPKPMFEAPSRAAAPAKAEFSPNSLDWLAQAETQPPAVQANERPVWNDPMTPAPGSATSNELAVSDSSENLGQVTFAAQGGVFDPCVSRDGKRIFFASTQHRETADLYVTNVGGRTVTQLTSDPAHDIMPSISPDAKRVAFASNRSGNYNIYVMSAAGGQAMQMTNDRTPALHPSWSPDGKRLVFCRLGEVSGRWELWVMDVDGVSAPEFIGYGLFPEWCPVASTGEGGRDRIAFQRSRERGDRAFSVWTVDYKPGDVSSPTEIATTTEGAAVNPTWSPDGKWLAYATVPFPTSDAPRPAYADLWMTDIAGGTRINLTTGRFTNLMPTWGVDGKLFFVSDRGGIDNVWTLGTERALAAAGVSIGNSNAGHGHAANDHGHEVDHGRHFMPATATVPEGYEDQGH